MPQDARPSSGRPLSANSPLWQWLFDGVLGLCLLTVVGGFAAWGLPRLQHQASSSGAHSSPPGPGIQSLRLVNRPSWLDDELLRPIARHLKENIERGGISHETLELSRILLERTGWFDRVTQLRLDGGELSIMADYSTPCALVEHRGREWLVGSRGQRLPLDFPTGAGPALPRIRGVTDDVPELAGELWGGTRVPAALATIAHLECRPWYTQIEAIEVGSVDREGILLRTRGGTLLRWGSADGMVLDGTGHGEPASSLPPLFGEVPPAQRLAVVDTIVSRLGSIDAAGFEEIDLTLDVTVGKRRGDPALAAHQ
ncbi:MAG: hypothetical protein O2819_03300 [Planctomycetota bacterium]|nr:hypothetical protein [Planctomycetota bacterium]MDA1105765.1 hypothetical protein [Planctomycetota bacterium]